MADTDYQQFLDSMVIGYDQWHDGIGYDLQALERLDAEERSAIEKLLIENLHGAGNWRDVEALRALGTPAAWAAVDEARNHRNARVRRYAIKFLLENADSEREDELEELVIREVGQGEFEMAEWLPTPRVKRALLGCTRNADSLIRVNAAALLLYLCGEAPEPFDWSQRPFFLRFAEEGPEALQSAWEELRRRTGL